MNYVLIQTGTNPRNGTKVYHEPDPENPNEPKCIEFKVTSEWRQKNPELLPNHRMCKNCSGESNRGEGGRSDLYYALQELDADDVGGSA